MNQSRMLIISLLALCGVATPHSAAVFAGQEPVIHFDMPPTAVAVSTEPDLVSVELHLSSMIESPSAPRIDQWLIRCVPRDPSISIADYAPRTETSSDIASSIQVKEHKEQSDAVGMSLAGSYGHLAQGNAVADRTTKNSNSVQYDRVAPVHAVTASGTIERGKGVYFKLRWTATQVLEGDKKFRVTMRVPPNWRAGLIDITVTATTSNNSFVPWDREPKTVGAANFVVAAYREGDQDAQLRAETVSAAESNLRSIVTGFQDRSDFNSISAVLRRVAEVLDLEEKKDNGWVRRLLQDRADPHWDRQIKKLPLPIRVAVLDYVDSRDALGEINGRPSRQIAAAKTPAL